MCAIQLFESFQTKSTTWKVPGFWSIPLNGLKKKGERKEIDWQSRPADNHSPQNQLSVTPLPHSAAEELWTWQTEVRMFSKWQKAAGLKTPYCGKKKNRLCRNNNNNNLRFVTLGAPHIEVSRKGNGKKLHASCSIQNLVLDSIPWHRQLQLPASSSVTAIHSILKCLLQ